ncbi:carboxymuconolactone decarboxylase family protein [Beijerinckia indica]|uniref:Carboxymuconolactone decarboxylase n=1 Tax=Beijerinckia indica subsp. indica (strain ATCC 9039 / DSM 1715 / NCIMB 8712) TaxID=395963 RepID=B2ICW7_BEII9|nr:carboxymuconolactone decarboxylase family protein [Beijerinckia indica]ACB95391.1 Carboxymuconolactone decarboxylase [Beijerinckia indica subsp. indica ATCC 9039]
MSHSLPKGSTLTADEIRSVSPGLARYAEEDGLKGLWRRPQLSLRDRSIVTVAILIARNQPVDLPNYLTVALDNGVTPAEISEIITHLAFYAGWSNAMSAISITKDIFAQRSVGPDQLPPGSPQLLPLDEAAEVQRAASVEANVGWVSPGLVQYTTDPLFKDLWLRPGLTPRDRSLVTVSALIANGQAAQITYHLNRAMNNGLTQEQAGEVITQAAFYAGWPNAFSAASVAGEVFKSRSK